MQDLEKNNGEKKESEDGAVNAWQTYLYMGSSRGCSDSDKNGTLRAVH